MLNKIVCAGVGGQGVLTLGMILAKAAASQGEYVTWVPEYGSEMRGGNACCKVKISDEPIVNPFMEEINILIALCDEALIQNYQQVEDGGIIMIDSDLVESIPAKIKNNIIKVPATAIANNNNNNKGMSIAMVGAIMAVTELFTMEEGLNAVSAYFDSKHLSLEKNISVFKDGYCFIKNN